MSDDSTKAFNDFVRKVGPTFGRVPWFIAVQPRDAGALTCSNLPTTAHQLEFLETLCRSFRSGAPSEIIKEGVPGSEHIPPAAPGFTATAGADIRAGETVVLAYDLTTGKMMAVARRG